ncbi:helix-turn-helix domain-containing protein [[Kitasatospora] papulosa]|uniref:helix-turn-helix domain-containing protein n=1 Tax=[Kitasatospora] papulosa TaxID=1464011 RepID=UPI003675356C
MNVPQRRRPRGAPFHHAPEAVTYAREQAGFTKTHLAATCGFSLQLLCDIEAGRRNATPEKLELLATALKCPVVVLEAKRVLPADRAGTRVEQGSAVTASAPSPGASEPAPGEIRAAS